MFSERRVIRLADFPFEKGDQGREVEDIQDRLVNLGYLDKDKKDVKEGKFGEGTDKAVHWFQQDNGLLVNGTVEQGTWDRLVFCNRKVGERYLYLRNPVMKGSDVKLVQRALTDQGLYLGHENGLFNQTTADAVIRFQKTKGLGPDGIVGRKTFGALGLLPN